MKRILAVLVLASATMAYGQNKTFSVGTPTPNPNAALHVESPTNNQGFIMPRLTTAQRSAMGAILTGADEGVMVYDTDLKAIQIWSGATWAGLAKLQYPYKDSVTTPTGTPDLFALKYNNAENKRLLRVESLNPANGSSAVSVQQNGAGIGVFSRVDNPTSGSTAIYGTTNSNLGGALAPVGVYGESTGTGSLAASFRVNNTGNTFPAVYAETNGTGSAINARNKSNTNGFAGLFANDSVGNTFPAIQASTRGPGTGVRVIQNVNSVGGGMDVFMQNPLSTASGLAITQDGLGDGVVVNVNTIDTTYMAGVRSTNTSFGNAGYFQTTNPNSPSPAVLALSNSINGPLEAVQSGPVGPIARVFSNDPTNTSDGIIINMAGTGNAISANRPIVAPSFVGDGSGLVNLPQLTLPFSSTVNNVAPLLDISASGSGPAAWFSNTDPGNASPALFAETAGTDAAIVGQTFTGFASIYGRREGATNGNAGLFEITDAANTFPALQTTTVGSGPAGSFLLNRAGSVAHALYAQSNGDSTFAAVHGNNVGNGFGVFGKSSGSKFASAAVYGEHTGTGDAAGAFRINNPTNTYAALYGETNGSGSALYANNLGTLGRGAQIQINNPSNTNAALRSFTNGLGNAAFLTINNVANDSSALYVTNNGTADGAKVILNNATSASYALVGQTNGAVTGAAVYARNTGAGIGLYARAENGTALGSAAVYGEQLGTGDAAGAFRINNPGNADNAVYGETNGSASAINANQLGTGRGMIAQINNPGNGQSAFLAVTNGTGPAIVANQSNGGLALDVLGGGIKLNVLDIGTPGTIDTKASVYNFTTLGTYIMGTTGRVNGEMVYVTCEADVIVDLVGDGSFVVNLLAKQTAVLIFVNGLWRSADAVAP